MLLPNPIPLIDVTFSTPTPDNDTYIEAGELRFGGRMNPPFSSLRTNL
jgi:hypothetical protein